MHWLDPDHLPTFFGTVDCFLVNPRGAVDGLILSDGTEVHFPPHLSREIREALNLGQAIKLRGVRPRVPNFIAAVMVETMSGQRIIDNGPPEADAAGEPDDSARTGAPSNDRRGDRAARASWAQGQCLRGAARKRRDCSLVQARGPRGDRPADALRGAGRPRQRGAAFVMGQGDGTASRVASNFGAVLRRSRSKVRAAGGLRTMAPCRMAATASATTASSPA
jgi:hypothetical protein